MKSMEFTGKAAPWLPNFEQPVFQKYIGAQPPTDEIDIRRLYSSLFKLKSQPANVSSNSSEVVQKLCSVSIDLFFPGFLAKYVLGDRYEPTQNFLSIRKRLSIYLDVNKNDREKSGYRRTLLFSKYGHLSFCWKTKSFDFNLASDEVGQIVIDVELDRDAEKKMLEMEYETPFVSRGFHYIAVKDIMFKKCALEPVQI